MRREGIHSDDFDNENDVDDVAMAMGNWRLAASTQIYECAVTQR